MHHSLIETLGQEQQNGGLSSTGSGPKADATWTARSSRDRNCSLTQTSLHFPVGWHQLERSPLWTLIQPGPWQLHRREWGAGTLSGTGWRIWSRLRGVHNITRYKTEPNWSQRYRSWPSLNKDQNEKCTSQSQCWIYTLIFKVNTWTA